MMKCVKTVSFSFLVNGQTVGVLKLTELFRREIPSLRIFFSLSLRVSQRLLVSLVMKVYVCCQDLSRGTSYVPSICADDSLFCAC